MFFILIYVKHNLEMYGYYNSKQAKIHQKVDTGNKNAFVFFLETMELVIVLTITVIPQAININILGSFNNYSNLSVFRKGSIIFKNIRALEKMGQIDCIVFEMQGTLTDRLRMKVENCHIFGA